MNYLIPILTCVCVAIVFFFIGKSFSKIIKPTNEELLQYSIDHVKFVNELNPLVKQIYLQFIDEKQLCYFQYDKFRIKISNLDIEYWYTNGEHYISFTKIPIETLKELNLTLKELNGTLTQADKKVLDIIAKRVVKNNTEFINRLFI
ncbi:hypothetical protein EOM09_02730 [bacterium]|nr:hypothetical protein [bacterium]